MITIAALADTHLRHAAVAIPPADILIIAGDITRSGTVNQLADALDFFRGLPHPDKIFVAGNHEFCLERKPERVRHLLAGFHYLLDEGVTLRGVRFWGSPWQPRFFNWAFNLDRGPALAEKWAQIPDDTDVLITHGPPRGHGDDTGHDRVGCDDLLARVQLLKPPLHVYGHIHEERGHWRLGDALLANVTTDEGGAPASLFTFDPATRRAELVRFP